MTRTRVRSLALLGSAIALGPVLAGCSDATRPTETAERPAHAWYRATTPGTGDAGLLTGTLADDGGCLVVRTAHGTTTVPVIALADGRDLTPGTAVRYGGGLVDTVPDGAVVPAACAGRTYWLVVSGG
ncbi:hypothetical protein [Cellulomonas sp. HZM]|uniref:hypothetical protein n=1 Tax=Cellulomonas sp. HZM TaxID=1454010 RepID=UPI00049367EC|nr:hypothetical protein [Cellulomonas sp. HZM]